MMPYTGAAKWVGIPEAVVANETQYPVAGVPQTVRVGRVDEFPVLYACGGQDTSDLCEQTFSDQSGALIADYTYLKLPSCAHDVLGCPVEAQRLQLEQAIVDHIEAVYTCSGGGGAAADCPALDPRASCGSSDFPGAGFNDGTGCSCSYGWKYDGARKRCCDDITVPCSAAEV
jgi:hypothetical protein